MVPMTAAATTHIHLHLVHLPRPISNDMTAGVKSDAFADQGDRRLIFSAAMMFQDNQPGLSYAALGYAEQGATAFLGHFFLTEDLALQPAFIRCSTGLFSEEGR